MCYEIHDTTNCGVGVHDHVAVVVDLVGPRKGTFHQRIVALVWHVSMVVFRIVDFFQIDGRHFTGLGMDSRCLCATMHSIPVFHARVAGHVVLWPSNDLFFLVCANVL